MRAKFIPLLRASGGLLACGYIILIAVRGQLGFYIHPRYHLLAVVAAIAGSMLLILDIVLGSVANPILSAGPPPAR